MSDQVEDGGPRMPKAVREAMADAENVTGGEFVPPSSWQEPIGKFGLWVGENSETAELKCFEIDAEQARGLSEAFGMLADDLEADE